MRRFISPLGKDNWKRTSHKVNDGVYLTQITKHFDHVPSEAAVRAKPEKTAIGRHGEKEFVVRCNKRFPSRTEFLAALGVEKARVKLECEQQEAINQLQEVVARRYGLDIAEQIFQNMRPNQLNAGVVSGLDQRAAAVKALNELGFKAGAHGWDKKLSDLMVAIKVDIQAKGRPTDTEFGLDHLARDKAKILHRREAKVRELVVQEVDARGIYPPPYDSARELAILTIMEGALELAADKVASPLQESARRYEDAMAAMHDVKAYENNPTERARALRELTGDPAFLKINAAARQKALEAYAFRAALKEYLDQLVHTHNTAPVPPTKKEADAAKALAQAAHDADPADLANKVRAVGHPFDLSTLELAKICFKARRDITPAGLLDARLERLLKQPGLTPSRRNTLLRRAIEVEAQRTTKPTDAFGPDSFVARMLREPWTATADKPSPFKHALDASLPKLKADIKALGNLGMVPEAQLIKTCAPWFQTLFSSPGFADSLPLALRNDLEQAMHAIDSTTRSDREKQALKMVWFVKVFGQALVEAIEAHGAKGTQRDPVAEEAARVLRKLILEPIKTQRDMDGIDATAAGQARLVWGSFGHLRDRLIA